MKRLVAVAGLTAAAFASSVVLASPSSAAVCLSYDININGQGQAQQICLP